MIDAFRGPLRGAAPFSACAGSGITRCKLKIRRRLQCEKTNDKGKEKYRYRYVTWFRPAALADASIGRTHWGWSFLQYPFIGDCWMTLIPRNVPKSGHVQRWMDVIDFIEKKM